MSIPFNKPPITQDEIKLIQEVIETRKLAGDGPFTEKCHDWLNQNLSCQTSLLTHSCTAALEMAAILCNLEPGDEVIMPSFTFVSTANAVVLRHAKPVFVDIRPDTLNIDEKLIEAAITNKTKAIFPVHYAGVSCEMDTINSIAKKHRLLVVEDAAQGLMATYKGKALGTIGHLGTLSFHDTKNIVAGEGGALLVNDPTFNLRSEIIRQKGTNRKQFFRGEVDKYTWVDIGSSFLPSEIIAAFLFAQLKNAESITKDRLHVWNQYHSLFSSLEKSGHLTRPVVPKDCVHNGHIYYLILPTAKIRDEMILKLKKEGVGSVFHYIPLHSSPAGEKFGRTHGTLIQTDDLSSRLLRLPIWNGFTETQKVFDLVKKYL